MNILSHITADDGEEFLLVKCGEESVHALAVLERICFPSDFWSEISFYEALRTPAASIYAAYNKELTKIVAYGVIYSAADEGDLANIAVIPEMRKRGLGRSLLDSMCRITAESGVLRLFLEVRQSNEPAISLYTSAGFEPVGKRKNYYVRPVEDAVIMQKLL